MGLDVRDEMVKTDQQEGAELPSTRSELAHELFLEQVRKKSLRQIFGLVGSMVQPAGKSIEREPIGAAQFFERCRGLG